MLIENKQLFTSLHNQIMPLQYYNGDHTVMDIIDNIIHNIKDIVNEEYSKMVDQYKIYIAPRQNFNVIIGDDYRINHYENAQAGFRLKYDPSPNETHVDIVLNLNKNIMIKHLSDNTLDEFLFDTILVIVHEFYHYMQHYNATQQILKRNPKAKRVEAFSGEFVDIKLSLQPQDFEKPLDVIKELTYYAQNYEIEAYADSTALWLLTKLQHIDNAAQEIFNLFQTHSSLYAEEISNALESYQIVLKYGQLRNHACFFPAWIYYVKNIKERLTYHGGI